MKRTLKTGGYFVLKEMFSDDQQTKAQQSHTLLHNWWAAIDTMNGITHNQVFTKQELKNWATNLELSNTNFYINEDITKDPFDSYLVEFLNSTFEAYMKRAKSNTKLINQGKIAIKHFYTHGYCSARSLIAIGIKKRNN